MVKKFYRTEEFINLQDEWYDKLKDEGFDDIEYMSKTGSLVKRPGGQVMGKLINSRGDAEYYRRAKMHSHHLKRANMVDTYVWNNHADGLSVRKIASQYNEDHPRRARISPNFVHLSIVKTRALMTDCKCWESDVEQFDEGEVDVLIGLMNGKDYSPIEE